MNTNIGSMAIVRKKPREIGDDSTTTIAGKAAAMVGGINLAAPVRSMRRHHQTRTRIIVACVALAVVAYLAVRWWLRHA